MKNLSIASFFWLLAMGLFKPVLGDGSYWEVVYKDNDKPAHCEVTFEWCRNNRRRALRSNSLETAQEERELQGFSCMCEVKDIYAAMTPICPKKPTQTIRKSEERREP